MLNNIKKVVMDKANVVAKNIRENIVCLLIILSSIFFIIMSKTLTWLIIHAEVFLQKIIG